jgi:ABC-type multidrug transport system permease subunit
VTNRSIYSKDLTEDFGKDSETNQNLKIGITTIILGISLLIIILLFLYLLSSKTGANFGIKEITFAIVLSLLITAILRWVKYFMEKNGHLGLVIGLLILGSSIYSLRIKFKGPYTNTFSIISSVLVLIYLFFHFYKRKN